MEDEAIEEVCLFCGSKRIKLITEWGDPSYSKRLVVPMEPIKYERQEIKTKYGIRKSRIPVFDVSKLFPMG